MPKITGEGKSLMESRNIAIRTMFYQDDKTVTQIARRWSLTPQRISQILKPRPDFADCRGCDNTFAVMQVRGRRPQFCSRTCGQKYRYRRDQVL